MKELILWTVLILKQKLKNYAYKEQSGDAETELEILLCQGQWDEKRNCSRGFW